METYELIKEAIIHRKQVWAEYRGRHRKMCPYILGTKNNKQQALFYQFGGSSERGLKKDGDNWRCMKIKELSNVSIEDGDWHPKEVRTYQKSTCVDNIDVEVPLNNF